MGDECACQLDTQQKCCATLMTYLPAAYPLQIKQTASVKSFPKKLNLR